jgi:hypothetical protein
VLPCALERSRSRRFANGQLTRQRRSSRRSASADTRWGAEDHPPAGADRAATRSTEPELNRRLRAAGSPAISVLAHPGYTATNLQTSGPTGLLNLSGRIGNLLRAQHVTMGALNQLYAATAPAVQGGEFYGPDGRGENRGHPKLVKPVPSATDTDAARRLWEVSEKLTGFSFAP